MKIAKSLIEFGLLITGVSEAIENEAKEEKKDGFLGMFFGVLGDVSFGTLLTEKHVDAGDEVKRASEGAKTKSHGGYGTTSPCKNVTVVSSFD